VDKIIAEQNVVQQPVVDSESFITHYKSLTKILNRCAIESFGQVKPYCGNINQLVTLATIQWILAKIRSIHGAIHLANDPEGEVWISSFQLYNKVLLDFQKCSNDHKDLRSYLIQECKKLCKDLYRERMEVVTEQTKDAD
jgi:hypothetical protein